MLTETNKKISSDNSLPHNPSRVINWVNKGAYAPLNPTAFGMDASKTTESAQYTKKRAL